VNILLLFLLSIAWSDVRACNPLFSVHYHTFIPLGWLEDWIFCVSSLLNCYLFIKTKMNMELIYKRLPSHHLFQHEFIVSLSRPVVCYLLERFGLGDVTEDDSELEDLQDMLFAFVSSYDGHSATAFHRLYELLMAAFPSLDIELVQSLLESNEGKLSKDMVSDFIELACESQENKCYEMHCDSIVSNMSVSRLLSDHSAITIDRNTVLIITDDDNKDHCATGSSNSSKAVVGVALGNSSAFGCNILYSMETHCTRRKYLSFGVHDLLLCLNIEDTTTATDTSTDTDVAKEEDKGVSASSRGLTIASREVYVTSVVFEYCLCLERVFDLFHYGWLNVNNVNGKNKGDGKSTWTPALEEAMLHLLIAVDDDLVALVR
jgi:hypothetical protein